MLVAFVAYVLLYASLHLIVLRWARPAFGWRRRGTWLFAAVALIMMVLPILSHVYEAGGFPLLARATAWPAYLWMLPVFWIVIFGLAADLWNVVVFLGSLAWSPFGRLRIAPSVFLSALLMAGGPAVCAGVASAYGPPRVTVHRLSSSRLPPGASPLRVVQISDVHLGHTRGLRHLGRIVDLVRELKPDILVCTGDLLDSPAGARSAYAARLGALHPPHGKFAVFGNHEFYAGMTRSQAFLEEAGFTVLRQTRRKVTVRGIPLVIAGVDALEELGPPPRGLTSADAALPPPDEPAFTILLKHTPSVPPETRTRANLQLSGHTHGGQIFPFRFFVRLFFRHVEGLYSLDSDTSLYVHRGIGTWGPPIRLLAPPEIALFLLTPAAPAAPMAPAE